MPLANALLAKVNTWPTLHMYKMWPVPEIWLGPKKLNGSFDRPVHSAFRDDLSSLG